MIRELFSVLSAALSLWNHKERMRYVNEVIQLKKDWYEEYNKAIPDDAVLDGIEFKLRLVSEGFAAQVRIANSATSSGQAESSLPLLFEENDIS